MLLVESMPISSRPRPSELCHHCGEALAPGSASSFCCAGCRVAHEVLTEVGFASLAATQERVGQEDTSEFDAPSFAELYVTTVASGLRRTELGVAGMHCATCVALLERLGRIEPAVRSARVDYEGGLVEIVWDPERATLGSVARAIRLLGYEPHAPRGRNRELARRRELRSWLVRIGVAGASAGNVMLMALALYAADANDGGMDPSTRAFFRYGSALVALPALLAASVFFRGAVASLRTRTAHMDLPIALGIAAAFGSGLVNTFTGRESIYFDSICVLVFLLSIGRYLTHRHRLSAAEAEELVSSVTPAFAQVRSPDGTLVRTPTERVEVDAIVVVASGDVVPVDGVIERGTSTLDLSLSSGESHPVPVTVGAEVPAGASNLGGRIEVRTKRAGTETRVAELMRNVERALSTRTPLVDRASRLAGIFTWLLLVLAAVTFVGWSFSSVERAFDHALGLLIVACPCALAMATPLAESSAVRKAARSGILFFRAEALERLARPLDIVFDKTGTLTEGRLTLRALSGTSEIWRRARALEEASSHPVARAIRDFVSDEGAARAVSDVEEFSGRGIVGLVEGRPLVVGSESFVRARATVPDELESLVVEARERGSPLLVALDGRVAALGYWLDPPRARVEFALRRLVEDGHRLFISSGDHPVLVERLGRELERRSGARLFTEVRGGVLPEHKAEFVTERLRALEGEGAGARRSVVMVGDGVNDAAALARADVGIAVRGAADASRLCADVFLGGRGVDDLRRLVRGAERTAHVIRRGLAFSLLYNLIGVGLAAAGLLNPLVAAVLMPVSSLTVVTNAYRSRLFPVRSGAARVREEAS